MGNKSIKNKKSKIKRRNFAPNIEVINNNVHLLYCHYFRFVIITGIVSVQLLGTIGWLVGIALYSNCYDCTSYYLYHTIGIRKS